MRFNAPGLAFLLALCAFSAAQADPAPTVATVSLRPLHSQFQLFGQVMPQHPYWVAAGLEGRVADLSVKVGDPIRQGEVIARLTGPSVISRLKIAQQKVNQDQADLASAKSILTLIEQKRRQKLATQEQLLKSRNEVSQAQTQLAIDQNQQRSLQAQISLEAPTDGQVTIVSTANGDYISSGQRLLTILPSTGLWVQARAYGQEGQQINVGQTGQFQAEEDGRILAVTVVSRIPDTASPGTWLLYLMLRDSSAHWFAGQAGTVTLTENVRQLPAVPSTALIMDQGQWWVMLKTGQTVKPVKVEPVTSHQGWTWLQHGVQAGDQILIQGAYQTFHQDFSKQYANPD